MTDVAVSVILLAIIVTEVNNLEGTTSRKNSALCVVPNATKMDSSDVAFATRHLPKATTTKGNSLHPAARSRLQDRRATNDFKFVHRPLKLY